MSAPSVKGELERETGLEPATFSLEGLSVYECRHRDLPRRSPAAAESVGAVAVSSAPFPMAPDAVRVAGALTAAATISIAGPAVNVGECRVVSQFESGRP